MLARITRTRVYCFYNGKQLKSRSSIQQGVIFDHALFSLGIEEVARKMTLEFKVLSFDDAFLGGAPEPVMEDLREVVLGQAQHGQLVHREECESSILDHESPGVIQHTQEVMHIAAPR